MQQSVLRSLLVLRLVTGGIGQVTMQSVVQRRHAQVQQSPNYSTHSHNVFDKL